MRKIMVWLLALLLLLTPVWALAEESILKQVDWTQGVVSIIGALAAAMSALLARVWTRYVRPWLEKRDMIDAAKIAVEAAEAMLGRYLGEDKWAYALNRMKDMGFNIEATVGTALFLKEQGIRTRILRKPSEGSEEVLDSIRAGYVSYVICTRAILSGIHYEDGVAIRRCASENNITMLTSLDTVRVLLDVLEEVTIGISTI